ncbi:MAG: type II restriction endonuclease subunit M [Coleofasciculus sp. B1-GNL1-01]
MNAVEIEEAVSQLAEAPFDSEEFPFAFLINPYLITGVNTIIQPISKPISSVDEMSFGNMPNEGGFLLLDQIEAENATKKHQVKSHFIRHFIGSQEFIKGQQRRCIWINDDEYPEAKHNAWLSDRFESVRIKRETSNRQTTKQLADTPYRFGEVRQRGDERVIVVAAISSENRDFLPCGLLQRGTIISNKCYALYDAPLWNMAIIASRLHWVWIGTVCVRMRTDFSYSNTLGWNTFPVPTLTEKNKTDLTRCAEDILLAREQYFPATIADMYDPERMDKEFPLVREAHDRNDEVLERIYIGRRFKNDTERLEKLFELYTKMTTPKSSSRL